MILAISRNNNTENELFVHIYYSSHCFPVEVPSFEFYKLVYICKATRILQTSFVMRITLPSKFSFVAVQPRSPLTYFPKTIEFHLEKALLMERLHRCIQCQFWENACFGLDRLDGTNEDKWIRQSHLLHNGYIYNPKELMSKPPSRNILNWDGQCYIPWMQRSLGAQTFYMLSSTNYHLQQHKEYCKHIWIFLPLYMIRNLKFLAGCIKHYFKLFFSGHHLKEKY